MEVVSEVACGLDVHQAEIVGCVVKGRDRPERVEARFKTTLAGRLALKAWLKVHGCKVVGMEASGIYWKPIHAVLEDEFQVIVGNPQHMKALRGRKTDKKDARWIADLVRHGLIAGSFIPPREIRELRDFVRSRKSLVEARSQIRNEVAKLLNGAGLPSTAFIKDMFGKSGQMMLNALAEGETCAASLAAFALGRMREKIQILTEVFHQPLSEHLQALLRLQLERHTDAEKHLAKLEAMIAARMRNHQEDMELICSIPGIKATSACHIFAEMGFDPKVFPSAEQLAAWCGVCPGSNESGGKKRQMRARKGNRYIRWILAETAKAATATKGSQFQRRYNKMVLRMPKGKATMAIAHFQTRVIRSVLISRKPYADLEAPLPTPAQRKRILSSLATRAKKFGYAIVPIAQTTKVIRSTT
jgi:transposase